MGWVWRRGALAQESTGLSAPALQTRAAPERADTTGPLRTHQLQICALVRKPSGRRGAARGGRTMEARGLQEGKAQSGRIPHGAVTLGEERHTPNAASMMGPLTLASALDHAAGQAAASRASAGPKGECRAEAAHTTPALRWRKESTRCPLTPTFHGPRLHQPGGGGRRKAGSVGKGSVLDCEGRGRPSTESTLTCRRCALHATPSWPPHPLQLLVRLI